MKQTVLIAFILLLSVADTYGQTPNIDSLETALETEELTPEKKMQLCWDIVAYCMYSDPDKTFAYAKKGLALSEDSRNDLWAARFSRMLSVCHMSASDYDSSLVYLEKALEYAVKAKSEREETGARLYMAGVYLNWGKHELALKHYIDLLPTLETMQPVEHYANALVNIAIVYQQLHHNDKALEYGKQAVAMAEKHDLMQAKMGGYALMGDIYYEKGQLDSTIVNVVKAYEIGLAQNNLQRLIICTQILAATYSDLEDYERAEKYAGECLALAEQFGDKQSLLMAWSVMAKLYFDTKQYQECERYAHKVWEADSTHLERAENSTLYLCFANIFLGNPEKADYFLGKYVNVRDSLANQTLHDRLAGMEVRYETEKKEIRIALLEKEQRLYVWLGIAVGLLVCALGVVLWKTIRNARKEKLLIATRSTLDGEIKERTRLARDLHDRLSGNLSAVKIELGNQAESLQNVRSKLDKCIKEIRETAHDMMPSSLQFGMKVALEDFAAQFPNVKFHFFGEEKRIDARMEYVLYCCANELVNNAIRHSGAKEINLQLVQNEKYVSLTVSDDGCGYDEKNAASGMGLANVRNRVTSCNGKIDVSTSAGKGTETTIELKIHTD
jgi:signal transduction histidine kinase